MGQTGTQSRNYYWYGNRDVDLNGLEDDIYGAPVVNDIRDSIQDWAREQGAELGIPVWVVLIDPGDTDVFFASDVAELISATDLNLWLANLETTSGTDSINVVIESTKSGSFIDIIDSGPASISGHNRVILTLTSSELDSYLTPDGAYFTNALFNALGQEMNSNEAFQQAVDVVNAAGLQQHPWIDDNGNYIPDNVELVSSLLTASSPTQAMEGFFSAGRGLLTSRSIAPEILHSETQVISTTEILLKVMALDDDTVSQVNVSIYSCSSPVPTGTFPVIHPVMEPLSPEQAHLGWNSKNIGTAGICWFSVVAKDNEGNLSAPLIVDLRSYVYLPLIKR